MSQSLFENPGGRFGPRQSGVFFFRRNSRRDDGFILETLCHPQNFHQPFGVLQGVKLPFMFPVPCSLFQRDFLGNFSRFIRYEVTL
jgi:hypothetical protein